MTIGGGVIQHTHSSASSGGNILTAPTITDPDISNAALVKLASAVIGNQATLDFDLAAHPLYRDFRIRYSLLPVTDAVTLLGRVSIDGGATFIATATYSDAFQFLIDTPSANTGGSINVNTSMRFTTPLSIGNAAAEGVHGFLDLIDIPSATLWKAIHGLASNLDNSAPAHLVVTRSGGLSRAADPITDFRLFFSNGNIASGRYSLYGYKV